MNIIEVIRYLTSHDGPNIPLRTLAIYCGLTHPTLSYYLHGKGQPRDDTRKQMEQGIRDLVKEIEGECKWLL